MTEKIAFIHRPSGAPEEMSDAALVAACGQGDAAALGALYDRYQADLFRFVSRMSGVTERDLDDIVQNTFITAHRAAGRFRGESSVRTWLFGIAVNEVRHLIRSDMRRKRGMRAWFDFRKDYGADDNGFSARALERREQLAILDKSVRELPPDQRVAFVMCELEDVPGVEAARALGVPQGTLWRRLHEARKALAASMKRSGI